MAIPRPLSRTVLLVAGLAFLASYVCGFDPPPVEPGEATHVDAVAAEPGDSGFGDGAAAASGEVVSDLLFPLPAGHEVRRHVIRPDGTELSSGEAAALGAGESRLVYSNTLGPFVFAPSVAGVRIADDIITIAADDCLLDRFVFRVGGNSDGAGVGPFSVEYALYRVCPGAILTPPVPIPGTAGTFDAADNGIHEVEVVIPPDAEVRIPSQLYFGLKFSRTKAGIVVGAPAEVGFSSDRIDFPGFTCNAKFSVGFPNRPHTSFYAQFFVRGDCPARFPIYSNSQNAGNAFSPGAGILFADDIVIDTAQLGGAECLLAGYEVTMKGPTSGDGGVEVDLRGFLDFADPANGGLIPGTRRLLFVFGNTPQKLRVTFDTPISLASLPDPSRLFVAFRTSSGVLGPILTCREADIGTTQDIVQVFRNDTWEVVDLGIACHAAFDVTVYCAGPPPLGACCDTVLVENATCVRGADAGQPCNLDYQCGGFGTACVGDAVCREVAGVNCQFGRWAPGVACEPDPFSPACGLGACCTPEDTCENLTKRECNVLVEDPETILWHRDESCEDPDLPCPFFACLQRRGECLVARDEPGCADAFCCASVCTADPFCCEVAWDRLCVSATSALCPYRRPPNDECFGPASNQGALGIPVPGSVFVAAATATTGASDPQVGCVDGDGCFQARNTVWFKFVATHTSARLSTCLSPRSQDSVLQVFRPSDTSSPSAECGSLQPMACNDDAPGCGDGRLSELCVGGLVPGRTYYVLLGSKAEEPGSVYQVDIDAPCGPADNAPGDECIDAFALEEGQNAFDLTPSTRTCLTPENGCQTEIDRDLWFEWTAPAQGEASILVCGEGAVDSTGLSVAVYSGCGCPLDGGSQPACQQVGTPSTCENGPVVRFTAKTGECFKIRVGASEGSPMKGTVGLNFDLCPVGSPTFIDPPDGVIDARQPFSPDQPATRQGIQSVRIAGPPGMDNKACWALCETASAGTANAVSAAVDNGDGTFTIRFNRPITSRAVTSLTFVQGDATEQRMVMTFHPGNVDGGALSETADIGFLAAVLRSDVDAPWGGFSSDLDRSGMTTPADLLRAADMRNAAAHYPSTGNIAIPACGSCCPAP